MQPLTKEEQKVLTDTNRRKHLRRVAAGKRVNVAMHHLVTAAEQVDAACCDISTIRSRQASSIYRELAKISDRLQDLRRTLTTNHAIAIGTVGDWELDHDPTQQELRCGHGPKHGCGRGKRK